MITARIIYPQDFFNKKSTNNYEMVSKFDFYNIIFIINIHNWAFSRCRDRFA